MLNVWFNLFSLEIMNSFCANDLLFCSVAFCLDILFMTASLDSTLKFWMVARAGVTKKYIPNFDRAEKPLTNVIPDDEHALAAGIDVR